MDQPIISKEELRAALIHALVSQLGDVGKTKIQKLVYFLQEAYGVSLECKFYMHQYGPYSEDIETSIANLRLMGYVRVEPDAEGYGFHCTSASTGESSWGQIVASVQKEMDDLVEKLGPLEAWELELVATIHYMSSRGLSKSEVVSAVALLKPKFASDFVDKKFDSLVSLGLIKEV